MDIYMKKMKVRPKIRKGAPLARDGTGGDCGPPGITRICGPPGITRICGPPENLITDAFKQYKAIGDSGGEYG